MEMCYNGAMAMPSCYAVVSSDEMEYIEAGATVRIVLKKDFLRDVVTASCCAIGTIVGSIIGASISSGMATVIGGAVGGALGWIIGGTLTRSYINKDLSFSVWIPFMSSRTWVIN